MKTNFNFSQPQATDRRGSTLVIVIALLGLLAFMGMVFFTFAAQERQAAENFSDAAKFAVDEPPNVFDHMLRQVIVGTSDTPQDRASILYSTTRRHALVSNLVGSDVQPHSGEGVRLGDIGGYAVVDQNQDGVADISVDPNLDWLEFVDSGVARSHMSYRARGLEGQVGGAAVPQPPAPDVDYTYPDINNLFLAFRGKAIRDNGPSVTPPKSRFEEVTVLIPSFFRPQYMKSSLANGPAGSSIVTDADWIQSFDGVNRNTARFPARSFRPHPLHIAGRLDDGTVVPRYVLAGEAAALGLQGGFPFRPAGRQNDPYNNTSIDGELGIWTGSHPDTYELDVDNDGDGTEEGIWMDLNFPIQETSDGVQYAILHSVTIYDLDSLIDLNVHGNLAGLNRRGDLTNASIGLVLDGQLDNQFVSRSNLGLGPNEVNPLWALQRPLVSAQAATFEAHYGRAPANRLEQANMEWIWLLTGAIDVQGTSGLFTGRWGEADRLYNTYNSNPRVVANLPRPGRSGNAQSALTTGIRFGGTYGGNGRDGFDDNQDRLEGEADLSQRRIRGFGTPMDYAGTGRSTSADYSYNDKTFKWEAVQKTSPREADLHRDPSGTGPERWPRYKGYTVNRGMDDTVPRYAFGQNGVYDNGASMSDDLILDPFYDALFEDPLETIFDPDYAQKQFDQIFTAADLFDLHVDVGLPRPDKMITPISTRLSKLAPVAFDVASAGLPSEVRKRFTTLSNSLRRYMMSHDLGADLTLGTSDDGPRAWEFNADADGPDANNDGYADGDGRREFPPAYGNNPANGRPYSATDPFRPQVRRLLTLEAGESRDLIGQLPLSINHLLDVERTEQTPNEQSQPVQFLRYMRRAGLRFRPLTEHPAASEGNTVVNATTIPVFDPANPVVWPPTTAEQREYWARRDRQQLARDIYVLLYTIGGAQTVGTTVRSSLGTNDPNAAEGTALYTHHQLREMAQFAVNLVDAMDTDNVVTKFEYDKNLGPDSSGTAGGWNLDDDPYTMETVPVLESDPNFAGITDSGRSREDSAARGVVYGVEAQELAFSEVLAVGTATPAATVDHPATLYPDETGRNHLFVELQNLRPNAVPLATKNNTTMANAMWRIVRHDRVNAADPIGGTSNGGNPYRAFAFTGQSAVNQTIPGGQRYSVATASTTDVVSSDLFVDFDLDNTFDLIAPNTSNGTLPNNGTNRTDPNAAELKPRCNLDLLHPDHNPGFVMVDQAGNPTTNPGAFLENLQTYAGNTPMNSLYGGSFDAPVGGLGFDLVLQRRANPNMPALTHGSVPGQDPNPWVDVDIIRVEFRDLAIADGDMATQLQQNRLPNIASEERREPLADSTRGAFTGTPANLRYNTIVARNGGAGEIGRNSITATAGFNLWQAHFDRDFASTGELFSVPLVGPGKLTSVIERLNFNPRQQAQPPAAGNPTPDALVAGAAKFLQPDFLNDSGVSAAVNRARDNRWYRLLQLVEVPSRVHRMLGNYISLERLPGRINLNTLRHWEVYAGLVDNPMLLDTTNNVPVAPFTWDQTPDENGNAVSRDRWLEFLFSRDGDYSVTYDQFAATPGQRNMLIPGTVKAKPFRSYGYRKPFNSGVPDDNGVESTVLRTLTADVTDGDNQTNRHWLEVNSRGQHKNAGAVALQHQHQVLSKLMNNTTTVSNTFIVFATAGYFEAVEHKVNGQGTGLYRIGSRIDLDKSDGDRPGSKGAQQRAVFVIDRTEAFRAYDPGSGDFDWKRLIKARAEIE